jgi:hypothetical protein
MRAKDEVYKPESERVIESGKNIYGGKIQGSPSRLILYIHISLQIPIRVT